MTSVKHDFQYLVILELLYKVFYAGKKEGDSYEVLLSGWLSDFLPF